MSDLGDGMRPYLNKNKIEGPSLNLCPDWINNDTSMESMTELQTQDIFREF